MHTALAIPAFALVALVGAQAPVSLPAAQPQHAVATVSDPDPADCPFCGGNPALHVKRFFELERITLALSTSLLR